MDRRDNFALQLTVIGFTLVVCVLAVTSYVYFDKFHAKQREYASLQTQVAQLQTSRDQANDEIARLRSLLTHRDSATLADIEAEHAMAVEQVAPSNASVVRPTYQRLVGHMLTAVNDAVSREARMRADLLATRTHIAREREVHQAELQIVRSQVGEVEQELVTTREGYQADRERMAEQLDRFVINIQEKAAEIAAGKLELATVKAALGEQLAKLDRQYQQVREQWESTQTDQFEHPDGKVTFADAGERIVHINLGAADLLRRGTTFNVYDEATADVTSERRKGKVEVTKVLGQRHAEARIIEDRLADPILSNDVIHTPLWQPGTRRRFAVAGRIDLDQDGQDDNKMLVSLITSNGGQIDCQVDHQGRRRGKLSVETRYLIVGQRPTNIDRTEGNAGAYDALLAEAKELGIDTISIDKVFSMGGPSSAKMVRRSGDAPHSFKTRTRPRRDSAY